MTKDRIIGVVSLAVGIAVFILTTQLPMPIGYETSNEPGPRLFPYIASILLIICGLGLTIKKQEAPKPFMTKAQWIRCWSLFGVFVGYVVGMYFLGFAVCTPFMLFITMTMFAGQNPPKLWIRLLYSVGITAIIYAAFVILFKSNIPMGILSR